MNALGTPLIAPKSMTSDIMTSTERSQPHLHQRRYALKWTGACMAVSLLLCCLVPSAYALDAVCRKELESADQDGDSRLDRTEYVGVVSTLSEGAFGRSLDFEYLPIELQEVFERHQSCQCDDTNPVCCQDASIDLSRLYSEQRMSSGVDDICNDIQSSIRRVLYVPIQAPVAAPITVDSQPRQINSTLLECVSSMNAADANDDNFLSQNEYMNFVNILTDDAYAGQGLADVPEPIRQNFFQLAGDNGQIDISGSKPADDRTPEQIANLQTICDNTVAAINAAAFNAGAAGTPTAQPTMNTTAPTPTMNTTAPTPTPAPTSAGEKVARSLGGVSAALAFLLTFVTMVW